MGDLHRNLWSALIFAPAKNGWVIVVLEVHLASFQGPHFCQERFLVQRASISNKGSPPLREGEIHAPDKKPLLLRLEYKVTKRLLPHAICWKLGPI